MSVVKVIVLVIGAAFMIFGYLIYFRKRYNLINGFESDYREGRRGKRYAERVGLIEFIIGIILLLSGILLLIFA